MHKQNKGGKAMSVILIKENLLKLANKMSCFPKVRVNKEAEAEEIMKRYNLSKKRFIELCHDPTEAPCLHAYIDIWCFVTLI